MDSIKSLYEYIEAMRSIDLINYTDYSNLFDLIADVENRMVEKEKKPDVNEYDPSANA